MPQRIFDNPSFSRKFNYRYVAKMMGFLCMMQVPFLFIAILISLYYHDAGLRPLEITAGLMAVVGLLLLFIGRNAKDYNAGRREGMLSVAVSWFVVSLIGMLPYLLGDFVPTFADAFFETISGFTTTGGTILTDIEALPRSILFWRSVTQWVGGIGIVVFVVALVPIMGGSASLLYNSETTGVTHERFLPRVGMMAKWVSLIYVGLSMLCVLLLWAGPMGLYDAVCHATTCISTGGFSPRNASIAAYDSFYIQVITVIFMLCGATNFSLLYFALRGRGAKLFTDVEFRAFLAIIGVLTLIASLFLFFKGVKPTLFEAVWGAFYHIVSIITSTGYVLDDYNNWYPFFSFVMLFAMFVGGCAGSTSGGLKVARFIILGKNLRNEFHKRTHPNAMLPVRIDGHPIPGKVVHQVLAFFFAYLCLMMIGAVIVSMDGFTVEESISAALTSISNTGPGIGTFGPVNNFASLSSHSKILLSVIMVMGRLEIFTVLTIILPSFWRS